MTNPWVPKATILPPWLGGREGKRTMMLVVEPPDPVWRGMSRADFLRIAAAIRWTADQMGLRDWRFQLQWSPAEWDEEGGPPSDCYARIEVLGNVRTANIWVNTDFATIEESEQRRTLVHEMIHVHLDPLMEVGDESVKTMMGLQFAHLLGEEMHRAVERACEGMAMNWYQHIDRIPASLTADDDIAIVLQDGTEMEIGEYLGLKTEDKNA